MEAQQPFSNSSLGPYTISPNVSEPGECSKDFVGPILSACSFEKVGESLVVSPTSFMVPTQVAGCLVKPHKAWVEAENGGKSISVPLMSTVLPIQVARCTETLQKDCDEAKKAGGSPLVPLISSVVLT